jgi:hypothetical protein
MNICAGLMEGSSSGRLPKGLTGSAKTAVGSSESPQLSLRVPQTPTILLHPHLLACQLGKPHSPHHRWYPNRKDGGRLRGERRPEEAQAIR